MKTILICFGTRPEAIKLAPVIVKLKEFHSVRIHICVTGQHRRMLDQMLEIFHIRSDSDLDVMTEDQSLDSLSSKIFASFPRILQSVTPDVVLVQGDTTTASIIAQSAYNHKVSVAHVEAGLRSHNKYVPFPEEINRTIISRIADIHFAPTIGAKQNLLQECISAKDIFVTGNTIVDALDMLRPIVDKHSPEFQSRLGKRFLLVTAHRRESFGVPLVHICEALIQITEKDKDVQIVYPVHLNPNVANVVQKRLSVHKNILLLPPVSYIDLLFLLKHCHFVLTDSGGIQEEAPSFGKPVLVLRDVTERPEGIQAGIAKLVGTNGKTIETESLKLLTDKKAYQKMVAKANPYGDGNAALRIVKVLHG